MFLPSCGLRLSTDLFREKTMRPAWSSMLALVAAAAVFKACVAAAAVPFETTIVTSDAEGLGSASTLLAAAAEKGGQAWLQIRQWAAESYERAPALMLGLSVLLAVPPLALAGFIVGRKRRSSEATLLISRSSRGATAAPRTTAARAEVAAWPSEAWVEIEGGGRCAIGRTLVRIGREGDNDIRLSAKTVHRYHAVIRRTTDGDVMITDVSGDDGNGVLVNGARVAEARLAKGDVINVGEVKLRFDARPV
jgi:hypothetical protein